MKTDVISIIDDDSIYKFTIIKTIESVNIAKKIHVFNDGEEGLRFLTNNIEKEDDLPDVIFLDLNMPYMDGWEFLEEFAQLKSKLPKEIVIYVVSSSVSELDIERAKEISDVAAYMVKPITTDKFKTLIQGLQEL
jgi:CheY-like chemotaxis protein